MELVERDDEVEMPSASAVSSIERPEKNRSSTIRHCCGSICSSFVRLVSKAIKSTFCISMAATSAAMASFVTPAPRFTAPRLRA